MATLQPAAQLTAPLVTTLPGHDSAVNSAEHQTGIDR